MLKRLSASFTNNNDQPIRAPGPSNHAHYTPEVSDGSFVHPGYSHGGLSPAIAHNGFPRPPSQSTPYSEQPNGPHIASGSYFPELSAQYGHLRSPVPSPRLPPGSPYTGLSAANQPNYLSTASQQQPIDRLALQKSLKSVETVLVTLDEYRELNVRLAKVEKKLGKSMKELAGSISHGSQTDKTADPAGFAPQSIVSALNAGSSLLDVLADTNGKFSKACQKEYDSINELCGKHFKRIAKEEGKHDEVLESLDAKLKKANFQYDKQRVKSGPSGAYSGNASAAHEQFVPLLSQLTDDITRAKLAHGVSMATKRDSMVREVARTMGNLSEFEFRRACDHVRKAGADIGPVMATQALLGEKPDKGEASPMPRDWPPYLLDQPSAITSAGPAHHPSTAGFTGGQASHDQSEHGLQPPRSVGGRFDSVASRTSSRRSSVAFAPEAEIISRQNSPRIAQQSLSPHASPRQYAEATVVQRAQPTKPSVNTSFPSYGPSGSPQENSDRRDSPLEESPSLRDSHAAKLPAVQTPNGLQHAVSQRGNVGYMEAKRIDRISEEQHGFADTGYETVRRVMPQGFELDETEMSPDKPLRSMLEAQVQQTSLSTKLDYGESQRGKGGHTNWGQEKPIATSSDLHRSASIESTASQQSFVARMKAKYAEEKEDRQKIPSPPSGRGPLPQVGTHSATSSSSSGSSGARVSSIAQKYEQNSSGVLSPSSSRISSASYNPTMKQTGSEGTARPQHKQRASLPVVPGTSQGRTDTSTHPSFCGCEECARAGYASPKAPSQTLGGRASSQPWIAGDDGTVRSTRSDRRVSMPVGYGGR